MSQDQKVRDLAEIVEWLGALDLTDIRYRMKKLTMAYEWGMDQVGIHPGDRVIITRAPTITSGSGWWPSRECLVEGATGTAKEVDFNTHTQDWSVTFKPDLEWEVHERGRDRVVRYWRTPGITPAGMIPAKHDGGQPGRALKNRHLFSFAATRLRRLADDERPPGVTIPGSVAEPCAEGFRWGHRGAGFCDGCDLPAWEHAGQALYGAGKPTLRPWVPGEALALRTEWEARHRA